MENAAISIRKAKGKNRVDLRTNVLQNKRIEAIEFGLLMLDAVKVKLEFELAKLKEFEVNK